ncbi:MULTISPECIES: ABC-2 transporter permease [unclassified Ruminococcus]|uniref:ABC-2 transporter permease n=1 Tax=unclassified Ruminococcus TaxID=2608920 RepID=UPI00210F17C5|nr:MULTISPECIES: ABC-2 transporter permease [unclassified Ruminococcus]MCQ4023030.1 hypothetical protein [Ruminococcus sp. zg-924]MCQ4115467.1 hypothetical protein [Ruminococcus sp. zg-921]
MKGIFLKNWVVLLSGLRFNLVVFTAGGLLIAVAGQADLYGVLICPVFLCSMVIGMLEYNERSKWELYSDTLPVGRKGTVQGLYLFSLSYFAAFCVLAVLLCAPLRIFMPELVNTARFVFLLIITLSAPMLIFSLTLPVFFKFGYKVFRVVQIVIIFVLAGVGGGFIGVFMSEQDEYTVATDVLSRLINIDFYADLPWLIAVVVGVIAVYFVSMLLSSKLYKTVEL